MNRNRVGLCALAAVLLTAAAGAQPDAHVMPGESIQAALVAHPGAMIYIADGEHMVAEPVTLTTDGSGLHGPGRIVQMNPDAPIVRVEKASGVRVRDVTLTRAPDKEESTQEGLYAVECEGLVVDGIRVLNNRSKAATIRLIGCRESAVRNCLVRNYKRVVIDDRTDSDLMGYAFRCIDGTGIGVRYSTATTIVNNRIIEQDFLATEATRDRYKLGEVTIMPPEPGRPLVPDSVYRTGYTDNWHQGSGIIVTGLGTSRYTLISGNYIQNAGQGIDLHADYVIVSGNIVNTAMMGMKAMHGSKHVLISGNQFTRVDLWGIMLMPGAASHGTEPAAGEGPAREDNSDGRSIIANNIISDFGYGHDYWNRMEGQTEPQQTYGIALFGGQLPDNPPLRDVVVTGNLVYPGPGEPRYLYALYIEQHRKPTPENIHIFGNLFTPGLKGISNVPTNP